MRSRIQGECSKRAAGPYSALPLSGTSATECAHLGLNMGHKGNMKLSFTLQRANALFSRWPVMYLIILPTSILATQLRNPWPYSKIFYGVHVTLEIQYLTPSLVQERYSLRLTCSSAARLAWNLIKQATGSRSSDWSN